MNASKNTTMIHRLVVVGGDGPDPIRPNTPLVGYLSPGIQSERVAIKRDGDEFIASTFFAGERDVIGEYRCVLASRGAHIGREPASHYLQRQNRVEVNVYETQIDGIQIVDHPGTSWSGLGSCEPHTYLRMTTHA